LCNIIHLNLRVSLGLVNVVSFNRARSKLVHNLIKALLSLRKVFKHFDCLVQLCPVGQSCLADDRQTAILFSLLPDHSDHLPSPWCSTRCLILVSLNTAIILVELHHVICSLHHRLAIVHSMTGHLLTGVT
jgi:hypothetical protein